LSIPDYERVKAEHHGRRAFIVSVAIGILAGWRGSWEPIGSQALLPQTAPNTSRVKELLEMYDANDDVYVYGGNVEVWQPFIVGTRFGRIRQEAIRAKL
jgi:hypothetical protein